MDRRLLISLVPGRSQYNARVVRAYGTLIALAVAACGGGGGGGDAATDGRAGTQAPTTDEMIDACVKSDGCILGASGTDATISGCLEYLEGLEPAEVRCIAHATTCTAVLACSHYQRIDDPSCTSSSSGCTPDGNVDYCFPGAFLLEEDCAASGLTCSDSPNGPYCDDPCTSETCVGDVLDRCDRDADVDCGRLGWTCDPAGPRCTDGTAIPCTINAPQCDGPDLIECVSGYEVRLDCNQLVAGTTCQTYDMRGFCGTAGSCNDQTHYCLNDTINFCAFGEMVTRDCTSYGSMFSGCGNGAACIP